MTDSDNDIESANGESPAPRRSSATAGTRPLAPQDPPLGGAPPLGSPFPRWERAWLNAAAQEPPIGLAGFYVADTQRRVFDQHRRHQDPNPIVRNTESAARHDVLSRQWIYRRSLAGADALVAILAVLIAMDALGDYQLRLLSLLVAPLMVLSAKIAGLYDKDELVIDHSTLNELPRLVTLATVFALLAWLARHYLVHGSPTTFNLLMLWLLLAAGLVAGRTIARQAAGRLAPIERCLLVGRRTVFERLESKFQRYRHVTLVGVVNGEVVGTDHTTLREIAERNAIHRIIIDTDGTPAATTLDIVHAADATHLQISLLPSVLGTVGTSVVFDDLGGMVMVGVPRFGLNRSSRALKRAFDLMGASVGLVCTAPLFALCAIAIKMDSPGPAFFHQRRIGRDGRQFEMLKFRSMVKDAEALKDGLQGLNEADGLFKIDDDPRITRVGRLLRRTCIDELPQLVNVLAGSMSLVGPRPLIAEEDSRVTGVNRRRLRLTPGMTGRWQTLGAAHIPLSEMVKIDYLYIANWSLWDDFKIVVETIEYLARGRGQ